MNKVKKKFQIIATLGPATKNRISELIDAGATAFRLNCSHLSLQELSRWLLKLEKIFNKAGNTLAVWLDLQGAKLRIGKLNTSLFLKKGDVLQFKNNYRQQSEVIPLPHQSVYGKIQTEDEILLDDGKIKLQVTESTKDEFSAEVVIPGELSSFKGFVIKNNEPPIIEVANRDRSFIEQTLDLDFVGYAISYLQTA